MTSGAFARRRVGDRDEDSTPLPVDTTTRSAVERSARVLEAVRRVARLVAQEPDGTTLLRGLAPLLASVLDVEQVVVASLHEDTLEGITPHGLPDDDLGTVAVSYALLEWVGHRRSRVIASAPHDLLPGANRSLGDTPWREVIVVPALHHAGHAVAVLLVANPRRPGGFDATDSLLLEALAEQVVVGLDRATLLGRLDEWSRSLEALLTFSAAVHQQREPEPLVNEMVDHAARFLKADGGRAGLAVADGPRGDLVMHSTMYWHDGTWSRAPQSWARNQGLPGRVLEHEFPYLSAEYQTDPVADPDLVASGQVHHAICVPIKDATHAVIGFFELHRGAQRVPFTWNEATFLESLADTTAMAIENSRLVMALAAKNEEIRLLFARHAERLEEERQHVARELHDEAGQALVGVKLSLQALSRVIPDGMPSVRAPLDELRMQVNQATARLRQLARRLRPPTLDQHGLGVALAQLTHEIEERSAVAIHLETTWLPTRRLPVIETAVFRITQEALTNVVSHAGASRVSVAIGECDDSLWVRISDDGCGFDPSCDAPGLGLRGIAERVHMLGGDYRMDSAAGRGSTLFVRLPVS
jgi:signal transduction histidine kinase